MQSARAAATISRRRTRTLARLAARGPLALRLALAAAAGVVLALGHAPVGFSTAAFAAMPVAVWAVARAPSVRASAGAGWAFGFGYLAVSLHWIGHAFLVEADAYAWMLPFAVTLLPAGLALFWALAAAATRSTLGRATATGRGDLAAAAALAGALTLAEMARGVVLTGFPWALPGTVWVGTPLEQLVAWIGPHGLGLVTLWLAAVPGLALAGLARRRGALVAGAALGAIALLLAASVARLASIPTGGGDLVVRLVQPNAAQHLKWSREHAGRFYRRLLEGSARPPDPTLGPPDLVVWPETAVAFLPEELPDARRAMAEAASAPLILGALARAGEGAFANALLVLDEGGAVAARYDKHHLVPFGEYVPLQSLFGAVGLAQVAGRGRFAAGAGPATVDAAGVPPFAALICYEAIFPAEVAAAVEAGAGRPRMLVQITNDAWFGTLGGPPQHLAQARLRAIEQGLPLLRAANTGISAVVDAAGRPVAALALGRAGVVDSTLPPALAPPLYARLGDAPAGIAALLLFIAGFSRSRSHPTAGA
ncbi:MAG: apolipoprotein N-acyltransferase [Paracoccaceae bacterium]